MNDPEYKGLDRVEEMFLGLPDQLTILCELLFNSNKKHEAKGIFLRHNLKYQNFEKVFKFSNKKYFDIFKAIETFKYDPLEDFVPFKDYFEPISIPSEEYLSLPKSIEVKFIDNEESIDYLKKLIGQKFIGIDSEWRPLTSIWHKTQGTSIL